MADRTQPAIHHVYLGLGSNMGDRCAELAHAIERLAGGITIETMSSVYDTAPMLVTDQPRFLNMVVYGTTHLLPAELLELAKRTEAAAGRKNGRRYGPRPVDVDILLYDHLVLNEPGLTLPHPRLVERAFVLQPLVEIAPDVVHPATGARFKDLLTQLVPADVRLIGPLFTDRH